MPDHDLSDLLPVPAGTHQPHPYQVFGLEEGEANQKVIKDAIKRVVTTLNAKKDQVDSTTWRAAAVLVKESKAILCDPAAKAELDARFGIIDFDDLDPSDSDADDSIDSPTTPDPLAAVLPSGNPMASDASDARQTSSANNPASSQQESSSDLQEVDPLAGVLPPNDPLARDADAAIESDPTATRSVGPDANAGVSPSVAQPTTTAAAPMEAAPTAAAPMAAVRPIDASTAGANPIIEPIATRRVQPRRRKRGYGGAMLAIFTLSMISAIGLLTYFLFFGPGRVTVTNSDGQISMSTDPERSTSRDPVFPIGEGFPDADGSSDSQAATRGSSSGDMGAVNRDTRGGPEVSDGSGNDSLAGDDSESSLNSFGDLASAFPMSGESTDMEEQNSPATMANRPATDPEMTDPEMTDPEMSSSVDSEPTENDAAMTQTPPADAPASTEGMSSDTAEPVAKGLDEVRQQIRTAAWDTMRQVAEETLSLSLPPEQQRQAETLYAVTDLATYYRRAIQRALLRLDVGSEIQLTDSVRLLIVDHGEDRLAFRVSVNSRQKSLSIDEFPFSLAGKLARMDLPESPQLEAAEAVYQAIAPRTNASYQREAIQRLRQIEGLESPDPVAIADALETLVLDADQSSET